MILDQLRQRLAEARAAGSGPQRVQILQAAILSFASPNKVIKAHNRPGDHDGGGGSGGSGGSGGGGSGSGKSQSGGSGSTSRHSVKLPSSPAKLNIQTAAKALDQMGLKLGAGKTALVGGKFVTTYAVTLPDGSTTQMSTDEIKSTVYSGAGK